MEQNLNSEKTAARASAGATSTHTPALEESAEKKMDDVAMKGAKRAENRFREDEGVVPGSQIFTK